MTAAAPETLQSALAEAKQEAAVLRIENSLLRSVGEGVLLALLSRRSICLLCGARMYQRDMRDGHRPLCPARPLADLLSRKGVR